MSAAQLDLVRDLRDLTPRRTLKPVDPDLARVSNSIAGSIIRFCRAHIGEQFSADQLRRHVANECPTAPGSADRVLRDLRKQGRISYTLVSRSKSLYRVDSVGGAS